MTDVGLTVIPLQGLFGGSMIGLTSAMLLLGLDRITGVSGMAARPSGLAADGAPWSWATAFVAGLPLGAAILAEVIGPVPTHLIAGAAIFGIGRGLSGLCPGPAIADFAIKSRSALIFVAPTLLGMAIQRIGSWRAARRLQPLNSRPT